MATDYKNILLRRGYDSEFISTNLILSSGEPAFAIDTNILKIGDGVNTWQDLKDVANVSKNTVFAVRNDNGGIKYAGQAIYAKSVHSNKIIEPELFVSDGNTEEFRFLGLVRKDIAINTEGEIVHFGYIYDVNTTGGLSNIADGTETWNEGDVLYVHPSIAGKLTKNKPQEDIIVAIILYKHANHGVLFVRPTAYPHIDDLHDVNITNISNHDTLIYNSGTALWENKPGITSDISNITGSVSGVKNLVILDQTTYDNISTKDPYTVYFIK